MHKQKKILEAYKELLDKNIPIEICVASLNEAGKYSRKNRLNILFANQSAFETFSLDSKENMQDVLSLITCQEEVDSGIIVQKATSMEKLISNKLIEISNECSIIKHRAIKESYLPK